MPVRPLYSFVATSRNDDHGGDILRRTQSWVSRLAQQAERHQVPCELVLVDWNPPQQRSRLADVLAWPAGSEWFSARVLVVPRQLHRELQFSGRLSMFQMIAKNVGIRRALGEFVIATNVDIIFSDEMFQWLKTAGAQAGRLYRSDRWDIPNEIQLESDLDQLLRRARVEAIRHNLKDGTYVKRDGEFVNTTQSQFDFSFYNPLRHEIGNLRHLVSDGAPSIQTIDDNLAEILEGMARLRENFFIPVLHTNGCGDFTMASRRDWYLLRGYPEWNVFSWAIDSVIIFQAHFNGLAIEELDPTITHYHIEHDYGSGWTPEGSGNLWARLDQQGIPYLSYNDFIAVAKELQRNAANGLFTVYNDLNWGFFERAIECLEIVDRDTAARPARAHNHGSLEEELALECILDFPLERSLCHAGDRVIAESHEDGGQREIVVVTAPEIWSYSLAFDIAGVATLTADCWLSVEVCVDAGSIFVGILNGEKTELLTQTECRGPNKDFCEVTLFVKDTTQTSEVVFRNGSAGGASRFRVRSVRIRRERPDADAKVDENPESAMPTDREPEFSTETGVAIARTAHDTTEELGSVTGIAGIKRCSSDVIVRILADTGRRAVDREQDCQAMIILPAGSAGAVLDLDPLEPGPGKIVLQLQVIQGEVVIVLQDRASGAMLLTHREPAGQPLTELELNSAEGVGSVLFTSGSDTDHTKVLLHAVGQQPAV